MTQMINVLNPGDDTVGNEIQAHMDARKTAAAAELAENAHEKKAAFLDSVAAGDFAAVTKALSLHPEAVRWRSIDDFGWQQLDQYPLHIAATHGYLDIAKALVDAGAAVDAESRVRTTPLSEAARSSRTAMVEYLLKQGADPNHEAGEGYMPLGFAAANDAADAIALLLKYGADVNQRTHGLDTALHFAKGEPAARALIDGGIDISICNNIQRTGADTARERKKPQLAEFIGNYAAAHAEQLEKDRINRALQREQGAEEAGILVSGAPHAIPIGKPLKFRHGA